MPRLIVTSCAVHPGLNDITSGSNPVRDQCCSLLFLFSDYRFCTLRAAAPRALPPELAGTPSRYVLPYITSHRLYSSIVPLMPVCLQGLVRSSLLMVFRRILFTHVYSYRARPALPSSRLSFLERGFPICERPVDSPRCITTSSNIRSFWVRRRELFLYSKQTIA